MKTVRSAAVLLGIALLIPLGLWQGAESAGPPPPASAKFAFQVVESFDAKYLGDTPGHIGRGGGLEHGKPNVSLGDPVYRGDEKVGTITSLTWDRSKGSLEVEFDPVPMHLGPDGRALGPLRIAIGDELWTRLGPTAAAEKGDR
jgi:hypothetical protein